MTPCSIDNNPRILAARKALAEKQATLEQEIAETKEHIENIQRDLESRDTDPAYQEALRLCGKGVMAALVNADSDGYYNLMLRLVDKVPGRSREWDYTDQWELIFSMRRYDPKCSPPALKLCFESAYYWDEEDQKTLDSKAVRLLDGEVIVLSEELTPVIAHLLTLSEE